MTPASVRDAWRNAAGRSGTPVAFVVWWVGLVVTFVWRLAASDFTANEVVALAIQAVTVLMMPVGGLAVVSMTTRTQIAAAEKAEATTAATGSTAG